MNPYRTQLPVIYLKPGEIYLAEKPTLVITVLGSCVSVTMFHRPSRVGAICHGLLPQCKSGELCHGHCVEEFKYVDCSIQQMVDRFVAQGIPQSEIEVKLFGGADMLTYKGDHDRETVGRQNVITSSKAIERERLNLVSSDVGGEFGRKILFYTHTGEVLLKRLKKIHFEKLYHEQKD